MPPLYDLTIHQVHELIQRREISSEELTQACLQRIEQVEPRLKAFVTVTREHALEQARRVDQQIAVKRRASAIPVEPR